MKSIHDYLESLDTSAILTIIGIILLFSTAIATVLIAPRYIDPTWSEPTNPYQVQMYEISDPNLYISSAGNTAGTLTDRQFVYHLKKGITLLAFEEDEVTKIKASSPELEQFITRKEDLRLKLTSRLLLLRDINSDEPNNFELYEPAGDSAFALAPSDTITENWVDQQDYQIVEEGLPQLYLNSSGAIYIKNPKEYRITPFTFGNESGWQYDPEGIPIANLEELKNLQLGFLSRQELIRLGEHIFAIEGCWYCHTDQTRTLIQDVVVNGSESYPAPPSSANEYIYDQITFPGTRRIGPDISRVGIKRPGRDWHKSHFWAPQTASRGSIMPSFRHFFDEDPRGTSDIHPGIPNYKFEAIFQYLMTKGTRITPPNQAWWNGQDPIKTKEIIEGQRVVHEH